MRSKRVCSTKRDTEYLINITVSITPAFTCLGRGEFFPHSTKILVF